MTTAISIAPRHRITAACEKAAPLCLAATAFVLPISVSATSILYLLAWMLVMFSGRWTSLWQRIKQNKAALSFWLLFALFLFGMTYTTSPASLAFHDLQKRHWLLITPFFIFAIPNDQWRTYLINAFLAAMLLTLLLSFAKIFGVDLYHLVTHHKALTNTNVFFEHIVQTFFMSVAAFIVGYRFFYQAKWRWFYGSIYGLIAINVLFMSDSATGDAVFLLQLLYLYCLRFRWKGFIAACLLGAGLLGSALISSPVVKFRIYNITHDYQSYQQGKTRNTIGLRLSMWHNALTLIKQRPWFGYGTGGIQTAMQKNLSPTVINQTGLIHYVENTLLNFMLEFGFLGVLVFLLAMLIQIRACFSLPHEYKHLMLGFLALFLAGGLMNSFFVSFCEAHLYSLIAAVSFSAWIPKKIESTL